MWCPMPKKEFAGLFVSTRVSKPQKIRPETITADGTTLLKADDMQGLLAGGIEACHYLNFSIRFGMIFEEGQPRRRNR